MEHLREAARSIESHLQHLGTVSSARRRGEELVTLAVGAHAVGLERIVSLAPDPGLLEGDPEVAEVLWVHRPLPPEAELLEGLTERLDRLLAAIEQTAVPGMTDAAFGLLDSVSDVYGSALSRVIEVLHDAGHHEAIREALDDDVAASALVTHGLHPDSTESRARRALEAVSTTFADTGPEVIFESIDRDGVVHLRAIGEPERDRWRVAVAAERAVKAAAPDALDVRMHGTGDDGEPAGVEPVIIPLSAIGRRRDRTTSRWIELPELAQLSSGELVQLTHEGLKLLACAVDGTIYVAVDPFSGGGLRLRTPATGPPSVESPTGAVFAFDEPLPVQRSGDLIEVAIP